MRKIIPIAWIYALSCIAVEPSDQPVKGYAEKYTGYDIDLGVGYSGLTTSFSTINASANSTHQTSWGASGVAIQARMGATYGFFDYWIIGLEWYGQYNSVKLLGTYQSTAISFEEHEFTMLWNLGFQGKIGFVYKPSNMIFILVGPDWGYYDFRHVGGFSSAQFHVGWRLGAGAEQKFGEHWVMKEMFDYGWYPSESYVDAIETHQVKPRLATLLFSLGYLF